MPKRAIPTNQLELLLDARLPVPLYKQLYEHFRQGTLNGQEALSIESDNRP